MGQKITGTWLINHSSQKKQAVELRFLDFIPKFIYYKLGNIQIWALSSVFQRRQYVVRTLILTTSTHKTHIFYIGRAAAKPLKRHVCALCDKSMKLGT